MKLFENDIYDVSNCDNLFYQYCTDISSKPYPIIYSDIVNTIDDIYSKTNRVCDFVPVNRYKKEDKTHIVMYVPGYGKEDILIKLYGKDTKDVLVVSSKIKKNSKEKIVYSQKEYISIEFNNSFEIHKNSDIKANISKGVLSLVITDPKKKEKTPTEIEIN